MTGSRYIQNHFHSVPVVVAVVAVEMMVVETFVAVDCTFEDPFDTTL